MRESGFLSGEFDGLIEQLNNEGRGFGKRAKAMLRKQGAALQRKTRAAQRAAGVRNQTGKYRKGIKKGKAREKQGSFEIRVYSNAPHAHLIEDGHDQLVNPGKGKGNGHGVIPGRGIGRKVGHVPGRKVFEQAEKDYAPTFYEAVEDFLDEVATDICR